MDECKSLGDGAATTRDMFNAALSLKEQLRGRAALLIADRTDIAASTEGANSHKTPHHLIFTIVRFSLLRRAVGGCSQTKSAPPLPQGLTVVHISAQLERFLWYRGCA